MKKHHEIIRIVIADDDVFVREGIREILERCPELKVLAQTENGAELIKAVEMHLPDIVLTDIYMPAMDGLTAARIIRERFPATGIIALSPDANEYLFIRLLAAGFNGIILKSANGRDAITAILEVYRGNEYYCPAAQEKITGLVRKNLYNPKLKKVRQLLTEKEEEILVLICQGYPSRKIGLKLGLSKRTVESYREKLLCKTETPNLAGLVAYAVSNGIYRER